MKSLAGFKDTGKRMLAAWSEGVRVLRDSRMYGLSPWKSAAAFEEISDPPKLKNQRTVIGRLELLAHRTKSKSKRQVATPNRARYIHQPSRREPEICRQNFLSIQFHIGSKLTQALRRLLLDKRPHVKALVRTTRTAARQMRAGAVREEAMIYCLHYSDERWGRQTSFCQAHLLCSSQASCVYRR